MTREQYQLYSIAKYYLSLAEKGCKHPVIMAMTTSDISQASDNKITMNAGMRIRAHLTSCAFRLCTLWETYKGPRDNYRNQYYTSRGRRETGWSQGNIKNDILTNLYRHIFYLLRDASGHVEDRNQDRWADREDILRDITNLQALAAMKTALNQIEQDLGF